MNDLLQQRKRFIEFYFMNFRGFNTKIGRIRAAIIDLENEIKAKINERTAEKWLKKWEDHSTVHDERKGKVGRKRGISNITECQEAVRAEPLMSSRKIARTVGCSQSQVMKVMRELKFKSYKSSRVQKLTDDHKTLRVNFCKEMLEKISSSSIDLSLIWFSDEKYFELTKQLNRQNFRIWAHEKPEDFVCEIKANCVKSSVWCALSSKGVIGPFYFRSNVDSENYIEMLRDFFVDELDLKFEGWRETDWFQQDGATPHCTNNSLEYLRTLFGERIISRRSEFVWPSNSPDLNPLDYFLWGYLEDRVLRRSPKSLVQLERMIRAEIKAINDDYDFSKVINNFKRRLELCLEKDGGHFAHLI